MYTNSKGESNRSHSKSEFQMFSLISSRHVGVPRQDTNMASAHSSDKFPWNVSACNSRPFWQQFTSASHRVIFYCYLTILKTVRSHNFNFQRAGDGLSAVNVEEIKVAPRYSS